jgi:hypothetical protein
MNITHAESINNFYNTIRLRIEGNSKFNKSHLALQNTSVVESTIEKDLEKYAAQDRFEIIQEIRKIFIQNPTLPLGMHHLIYVDENGKKKITSKLRIIRENNLEEFFYALENDFILKPEYALFVDHRGC